MAVRSWLLLTTLCFLILSWWGYLCWQNRPTTDDVEPILHQFQTSWPNFEPGLIVFGPLFLLSLVMARVSAKRVGRKSTRP